MSYQHLTQSQRYQIATLHKGGLSSRQIAKTAKCHHSTIAREINRNGGRGSYGARKAHGQATQRRHRASSQPRIDEQAWATIEQHLRKDWSPEQIVCSDVAKVSIERIYQYIAADRARGGDLWRHRRRRMRSVATGSSVQFQLWVNADVAVRTLIYLLVLAIASAIWPIWSAVHAPMALAL